MISARVREALATEPKRDHLDLHEALAKVVAACERIEDTTSVDSNGRCRDLELRVIARIALQELELALKEVGV